MCTDFYEAQATLLRRKQVTNVWSHKLLAGGGDFEGEEGKGAGHGAGAGALKVQIYLQEKHLTVYCLLFLVYDGIYSSGIHTRK